MNGRGKEQNRLRASWNPLPMERPIPDWLIHVDVPISDLYVKSAGGVGADPCLEMNRCSSTAKVRKRDQIAVLALLTFWQNDLHPHHPSARTFSPRASRPAFVVWQTYPSYSDVKRAEVYTLRERGATRYPLARIPCGKWSGATTVPGCLKDQGDRLNSYEAWWVVIGVRPATAMIVGDDPLNRIVPRPDDATFIT